MIITNSNTQQTFNCMFRDGQQYTSGQLTVCVQKDGYSTINEYTPSNVLYRPNYATIIFDLNEETPFVDGESYLVTVKTSGRLLFRDKLSVWDKYVNDTNTQFSVYTSDYTFTEDSDEGYTVIESGATGGNGAGDTSSTDTSSDDTDNDGYGNVTRLGSTSTVNSFNIMGEFTVDESQFGTFQTASGYTAHNVRDMNARQPSDVGTQPFYSQNGLADGFDGYVKYREGYDERVMQFGRDFDALSLPVDDIDGNNGSKTVVADFMEADNAKKIENWDDVIYLDSSKTDITVGDSIYADAEGTMLASGTTNGRKNREWFLWTDGDVVKVTAGVVTHKYNYKDQEDEKWSQYIGTPALSRQTYDGTTVTTDNESITGIGKAWQGAFDTGSLVTTATIDDVATQLQTAFNNGFAIVETTYNPDKRYNYIDNSISDPTAVGEYLYQRIDGFNAGRRLSSDLEINQRDHIYDVLGTTVDESYRFGETYFAYLPVFGFMSKNFNFPADRGAIIIEYDKYTGQILNRKTVYKNNN